MKKFLLLGLIFGIFLISMLNVEAALNDSLVSRYSMEDGSGSVIADNVAGLLNASLTAMRFNGTVYRLGNYSIDGEDGTDYANRSSYSLNGFRNWTLSFWWNPDQTYSGTVAGNPRAIGWQRTSDNRQANFLIQNDADWGNIDAAFCWYKELPTDNYGNAAFCTSTQAWNSGSWYHFVISCDNSTNTFQIWVNVTLQANTTSSACGMADYGSSTFRINTNQEVLAARGLNAKYDEVCVYNRTITPAEVGDLWNGGSGQTCTFGSITPDPLNITSTAPSNNTQFNTLAFSINVTVSSNQTFQCNLSINSQSNGTALGVNSSATTVSFNFTAASTTEQNFNYSFGCNSSVGSETTGTYTFYVDNVNPIITPAPNLRTNVSYATRYNNLTGQFNLSDFSLFSWNITIDGILIANLSNILTTTYSVNFSRNVTNVSSGMSTIITGVCDGHTARSIPDYGMRLDGTSLEYFFEDGYVRVTPSDRSKVSNAYTQKRNDRYDFSFEFYDKPIGAVSFIVESSNEVVINKKKQYKGWLIVPDLNKWIDFETIHPGLAYSFRRIDPKTVEVTIAGLPNKQVTFNSIGELNCVSRTWYWLRVADNQSAFTEIETSGSASTFYLNLTYNSSVINQIGATLYWNNTPYPASGADNTDHYTFTRSITLPNISSDNINVTFYWNFSINTTGDNDGLFMRSVQTQQIYRPGLDNCSVFTTRALNYTLREENNDTIITGDINYIFNYTVNGAGRQFNSSESNSSTFDFCIYPNGISFELTALIQYDSSGYGERDWIREAYTVDNSTDQIPLYLLSTGLATLVTIHVVDASDNNLQGILVLAERYNPATDSYKEVESEYTDSEGNAVFDIDTDTAYYRFKLYRVGVLKILTEKMKIFTTTLEYIIDQIGTSLFGTSYQLQNSILANLTCDNATTTMSVKWLDVNSLASTHCFIVSSNNATFYNTCSVSDDSSLSYTATQMNISYTASFLAESGSYNYTLDTCGLNLNRSVFGPYVQLTVAFFVFLTLLLLGLQFDVRILIVLGVVALLLLYLMNFFITFTVLVSAIAIGVICYMIIFRRS